MLHRRNTQAIHTLLHSWIAPGADGAVDPTPTPCQVAHTATECCKHSSGIACDGCTWLRHVSRAAAGESYGGVYVPLLAQALVEANRRREQQGRPRLVDLQVGWVGGLVRAAAE